MSAVVKYIWILPSLVTWVIAAFSREKMLYITRCLDPEAQHPSSLVGQKWWSLMTVLLQAPSLTPEPTSGSLSYFPKPRDSCLPLLLSLGGWTRSWYLVAFLSEGSTHPSSQWSVPSSDGIIFPYLMNWMERVVHTWAWQRGGPFCAARILWAELRCVHCSSCEDGWTKYSEQILQT